MDIKKAKLVWGINQLKIPCTQLEPTKENALFINNLINEFKEKKYNTIERTPIGSFSYSRTIVPAYDMRGTRSCFELTVADKTGIYRIQFRTVNKSTENQLLYGSKAFKLFRKMCEKYNINLDDYAVDNGKEIKKTIDKYLIELFPLCVKDEVYDEVHHIDFHSSFPSGLVNTHPEFRPIIEELYMGRKIHPEYKYILNATIGYMQSVACCGAKWANLSKDAIHDNNERLLNLKNELIENGRIPLAANTDGIWYRGEIYHNENEGPDICQWHNDHTNCVIRFKSKGSYEFIENRKYTPVVRGRTSYDEIVPRENWKWGDIYRNDAVPIKFYLEDDLIILDEGE